MTAPISIAYEDWKATVDAANKAQERVKKLEDAIDLILSHTPTDNPAVNIQWLNNIQDIARKALEE